MNKTVLLLLVSGLLWSNLNAQFVGLVKEEFEHEANGLDPYKTYTIYALMAQQEDQLLAIYGGEQHPVSWIQALGEIYQDPLGGATSLELSSSDLDAAPLASFDSFLSIGFQPDLLAELGEENMLVMDGFISFESFEAGTGAFIIGSETVYSFIGVPSEATQSYPDEDGKVFIAQITSTEGLMGEINLKIVHNGEILLYPSINLSGASGCTDPLAANFNDSAVYYDASCIYPLLEGCTNEQALNFDPEAVNDDGSCILNCDELELSVSLDNMPNGFVFEMCTDGSNQMIFQAESQLDMSGSSNNFELEVVWGDGSVDSFNTIPNSIEHEFTEESDYEIELVMSSDYNCSVSAQYTISIIKSPEIAVSLLDPDTELCVNEELSFELLGWDTNHASTTYSISSTSTQAGVELNHPPVASQTYSFSAPSCDAQSFDGLNFAYGIRVEASNQCGSMLKDLPPIYVSGAQEDAQVSFEVDQTELIGCVEEAFSFINTSSGYVIASEEGCVNSNLGKWSIEPIDGWEIEAGDLNTPNFISLRFTDSAQYTVELSDNELCAAVTTAEEIEIVPPAGLISGLVTLNGNNLEGMEVQAFEWSDEAGEFMLAQSTMSEETGYFEFDLPEGQYQLKAHPNNEDQSGIIPMFSNEVWKWELAEILEVGCLSIEETQIDLTASEEEGLEITLAGGLYYRDQFKSNQGDPIPGIPIIIEKDTANNQAVAAAMTDALGNYSFLSIPPGDYRMYVDIPGLPMHETHYFTVDGSGLVLSGLNFYADTLDQIYINDLVIVSEQSLPNKLPIKAYPNPTSSTLFIELPGEDLSTLQINWFDALGKPVRVNSIRQKDVLRFELNGLGSGVYHYQIYNQELHHSGSVIKQ